MGGDEVDAAGGAPARPEHLLRAREAAGQLAQGGAAAFPEPAHAVAETVVPLAPARREAAELVTAGTAVPRLRDQLQAPQLRILLYGGDQRRLRVEPVRAAPEHGGQVEAEPADSAAPDPGPHGVHHQPHRLGAVAGQGVARAAVVDVAGGVVGVEPVIAGVVQAAQRQGRPQGVALAGVVEHHVEHGLDPGGGEGGGRGADLGPAARGEPRVRRPEHHRVVAPVVGEAQRGQVALVHPGRGRQQLEGGDAERLQVRDHGGVG